MDFKKVFQLSILLPSIFLKMFFGKEFFVLFSSCTNKARTRAQAIYTYKIKWFKMVQKVSMIFIMSIIR